MKILLYSRVHTGHVPSGLKAMIGALDGSALSYSVNDLFASQLEQLTGIVVPPQKRYICDAGGCAADADAADTIAISYGGDGTFLDCVKLFGIRGIPVLGVNSGRLGFLANVSESGFASALADLASGKYTLQKRTLLEAGPEGFPLHGNGYAFNEFSIQRKGAGMIAVEAFVNGEMVATYWGDGVILSTPSGSTAYSLSVGGPVVDPRCGCLVLSPIAPHNLTMRPVVVPDDSEVSFTIRSREGSALAALDSDSCEVCDGTTITLKRSEKNVFLVRLQNISFYDTLRNKMLWGFDRRDEPAV